MMNAGNAIDDLGFMCLVQTLRRLETLQAFVMTGAASMLGLMMMLMHAGNNLTSLSISCIPELRYQAVKLNLDGV